MSLHQKLLSAGLEAFDAPPAAPVVAAVVPAPFDNNAPVSEDPELIREETAARLALVSIIEAERDEEDSRSAVYELRRLSDGLEGLMVEIQNVNNPEEPTEDEMAMLKATAQQVRKELLEDGEQELVINVENGILVGSQEGLADALSNVAKKIGFALGNAAKGLLSKGEQAKAPLSYNRKLAAELKAKIDKLGTTEFDFTMPADLVRQIRVSDTGPVDALKAVADFPAALDAWYLTPADAAMNLFEKHANIVQAIAGSKTLEEFNTNYAKLSSLAPPLPAGAKRLDPINTRDYIFDVNEHHPSMGRVARYYYVARPDVGKTPEDKALDNVIALAQYSTGIYPFDKISKRKATDEQVKFSAAEVKGLLDDMLKACDVVDKYLSRLAVASTMDKRYNALVDLLNSDLRKQEWCSTEVNRMARVALISMDAYYSYGFAYTSRAYELMEVIVKLVKKAVYKSDLSK
ncbi:hypothetical protein RAY_296 [Erwinia phage vB_EamM_RAY]|uniref:Uncharacterized protein n=3 Tax=Agricanvirus TaxID=1984776 RepID=A0A173GEQ2_9CAUD|nr:hypothetical protein FDH98_gp222 [Erwinia phage vB_EamM_RAY]YP_009622039.1 hypothetical protein FDJ23_gp298 [Erwinia phage vB_EamM_Desertfox]ANH52076.1 hypothetical protein RAY_296 [Erwinia phage vB_EamM_RAY]AUG86405.1 hypothetical protein DESERTFOX_298 [Erwinia phage vB_EamM_Desertfox]QBP07403.1 hypothetical protein REBECCA_298 [Erwinia phage Rebecca]